MKRRARTDSIPCMSERGQAKPIFFCCGCAAAVGVAVTVAVIIISVYWMEIMLSFMGAELESEPLDIPVRTVSEDEVAGVRAKIAAHLQTAAQGEAEDLVLEPEEFELLVASAFHEGQTPEEISGLHVSAEEDKLRVQVSYELKEGKYLNVDFTGGVKIADGKLSLDFARCRVGPKEIETEELNKFAQALTEGIDQNPDAAEAISAFEKLETSGGKLRIRLSPEAAEKILKEKEPAPDGVEI